MTQNNVLFIIVSGPSKYDLMLALFDSIEPRRSVGFEFSPHKDDRMRMNCKTRIQMVQREDGSGESWNFEGDMSYDNFVKDHRRIAGYYSTRTRTGNFRFAQ